jgi:hypothetical protein
VSDEVNAVLTFRDESGREWLAAATIGPLTRFAEGKAVEAIEVDRLKDRAFMLYELKLVERR